MKVDHQDIDEDRADYLVWQLGESNSVKFRGMSYSPVLLQSLPRSCYQRLVSGHIFIECKTYKHKSLKPCPASTVLSTWFRSGAEHDHMRTLLGTLPRGLRGNHFSNKEYTGTRFRARGRISPLFQFPAGRNSLMSSVIL